MPLKRTNQSQNARQWLLVLASSVLMRLVFSLYWIPCWWGSCNGYRGAGSAGYVFAGIGFESATVVAIGEIFPDGDVKSKEAEHDVEKHRQQAHWTYP